MTISIGAKVNFHTTGTSGANGTSTFNTQAGGSRFVIGIESGSISSITDNYGNTWAQEESIVGSGMTTNVWSAVGKGGSNHIVTVNFSSTGNRSCALLEIINGAGLKDKDSSVNDTSSPWTTNTGTLVYANEVVIAYITNDSASGTTSFTEGAAGMTKQLEEQDGTVYFAHALYTKIVSTKAALAPSFTATAGTNANIILLTYREMTGAFDAFYGADTTVISSRNSDSGHSWTRHASGPAFNLTIVSNTCQDVSANNPLYYLSWTPDSAEYDVQGVIYSPSNDSMGICGRMDTSALTFYYVYYQSSGSIWRLIRYSSGTPTELATYSGSAPTTARTVRLVIRDTVKMVLIDGVVRLSSTDNTITAAGKAGIVGDGWGAGQYVDNFEAFNVMSGSAVPGTEFFTSIDVTPATSASWVDVNVAAFVPSGATGVILRYSKTVGGYLDLGFRKNGSTDNRHSSGGFENVGGDTIGWAIIGIDTSRIFECYAETAGGTGWVIELFGYVGSGWTFFTNASDKTPGSDYTWTDMDISSDTGTDTALGALWEVDTGGDTSDNCGVRCNGSTDARTPNYESHNWVFRKVDGSEIGEGHTGSHLTTFIGCYGYVDDSTCISTLNTNATSRSLGSTGSYIDLTALPADSVGSIYEIYGNSTGYCGLRKNGSSDTRTGEPGGWQVSDGYIECDGSQLVEMLISSLDVDIYEHGGMKAGEGPAPPPGDTFMRKEFDVRFAA